MLRPHVLLLKEKQSVMPRNTCKILVSNHRISLDTRLSKSIFDWLEIVATTSEHLTSLTTMDLPMMV